MSRYVTAPQKLVLVYLHRCHHATTRSIVGILHPHRARRGFATANTIRVCDALRAKGLIEVHAIGRDRFGAHWTSYRLTAEGEHRAVKLEERIPD